MTRRIVNTFWFGHVDFDRVLQVSKPMFLDRHGWFIGFSVTLELSDKPLEYWRELVEDEYSYTQSTGQRIKFIDGTFGRTTDRPPDQYLCYERMATNDIQEFVAMWRGEPLILHRQAAEQMAEAFEELTKKDELLPTEGKLYHKNFKSRDDLEAHIRELGEKLKARCGSGKIMTRVLPREPTALEWTWVPD